MARTRAFRDESDRVTVLLLGLQGASPEVVAAHVRRQRAQGIRSWILRADDPGSLLLADVLSTEEGRAVRLVRPPTLGGPSVTELCEESSVVVIGPSVPYRDARAVRRYSWRTGLPIVDLRERGEQDEAAGTEVPRVLPDGPARP